MPEPDGHRNSMRAGAPLRVGSVTLLPIERLAINTQVFGAHRWFAISREPVALVVKQGDEIRTVGIRGEVSLQQLREQIPELDKLISVA